MRKSNWFVIALAAVAAIALLCLWYFLGFNKVDSPLDLLITVVWWIVIALVVIAITRVEAKRRQKMRVAFIGDGFLYNPEAGLVMPDQGESEVSLLERTLASLTYTDKVAELDRSVQPAFRWVVRSLKFSKDKEVWKGEVQPAHKPNEKPQSFETREELIELLSA